MPHTRARNITRYTVAVASVGTVVLIKLASQRLFGTGVETEAPFMLSLAAVMLSGWYGGMGPGVLATLIAAFTGEYFFMPPTFTFIVPTGDQRIRLVIFVLEGTFISFLCQSLKSARLRAEANERETRTLQRDLLDITDSEQRRIGHDLHDGLGQHLTGIAFKSKLVEQRLAAKSLAEAEDARKISAMVNTAIGWTRDLARGLAPVNLDQEDGLASTLKLLAESTTEMFGCDCRFETAGEITNLNASVAGHLFRMAQEAINNAIKHGKPAHIRVSLIRQSGKLVIQIEDDGVGLKAASKHGEGMGMRIMNYRAKMIAGTLRVELRQPAGTIVSCTCPFRESHTEKNTS